MKPVVVRNIKRADPKAIATFEKLGASTTHEALGRYQLMKPYMRPVWAGACIAGPAVTILAQPGDNWMLHVAIEQCQPGDIVVLGCTADNTDGMIGDLIATSLKARGVKGVVLDAGCRDVATLKEMGFPIWARAISSKGTVKATLGSVNIPVVCAGVNVEPGDAVVADDEDAKRVKLASGILGLDMYNMREPLAKAGLRYVDNPEDV
jgi:4-hydroxy-4-methyl-2-oxoglutarate aldolase